jgi:DNA-binding transcriptional ArsR family regulator
VAQVRILPGAPPLASQFEALDQRVRGQGLRSGGSPFVHRALYCRDVETVTYGQVLARFGHALSDPTRSRLLLALRDGPAYPADLAALLGTSRQNLSNHLACLRGCGLVAAVPEGRRTRYELADPHLAHAIGDLLRVVLAVDPQACEASEADRCC